VKPSSIRILIVDDREENILALEAALKGCGYIVMTATSGNEAVRLVSENDFFVILLDVQMPIMDGFETARHIRAVRSAKATPIIFVTALYRDEEYEQLGYIAGAVDYLFKPINVDILKAKVAVFAELYRKNEENLRQGELLKIAALRDQENLLLKEALHSRDEFLSIVSHELKTPITPLNLQLQMFIQMYKDGSIVNVPQERLIRLLETSQKQVERLSRLVNDLVDVSRIKSQKLELKRETVDLVGVVQNVITAFSEELKRVGCPVNVEASAATRGSWDPFRLEQVVVNLLTNAMKYGSGKSIAFKIWSDEKHGYFSVSDNGIGIAIEDHVRIFERFERASSSDHYGGLGLGLYISREIVRLHGGAIKVESASGEGARFIVQLPKNV
jgi:signal transduction histidine kinase